MDKTLFQILSLAGAVLFEGMFNSMRDCVLSFVNAARERGSRANLSGADLSRADLSGADLSGANLSGANLSRANLSRANLSRANLSWANLSWANLSRANLSGADLSWANLSRANLSRANLSWANLSWANLSWANLSWANLSWANLSRADLSRADLSRADLSRADLSRADLSKPRNLHHAVLTAIRNDVWIVLSSAPAEAPAVLEALRAGKVDGSVYTGDCACLVGTIANARKCDIHELGVLVPDSSRLAEQFFAAIHPGDTPKTSEACAVAAEWVGDWVQRVQAAFAPTVVAPPPLPNYVGPLKEAPRKKGRAVKP